MEFGVIFGKDFEVMEKMEQIYLHSWTGNRITEIIMMPEEGCMFVQLISCFNS